MDKQDIEATKDILWYLKGLVDGQNTSFGQRHIESLEKTILFAQDSIQEEKENK